MKQFFSFLAAAILLASCGNSNDGKPKIDSASNDTAHTAYFGDKISPDGAIKAEQVKAALGKHDSLAMKVEGKVVDVCQRKGCWMEIKLGDAETMRVTFKDYGFFVPKNTGGKTVIVEGYAYNDTTTVAELRHYASDGGKTQDEINKITEPEVAVTFEAKGVIIKD
jgi:hypothetical protein